MPTPAARPWARRIWLVALAGLLAAGCTPAEIRAQKPMDPAMERLLAVSFAYGQFHQAKGREPRGPDDLRGLLAADALVSPRDGEPFVILWGAEFMPPLGQDARRPILAYEKRGRDGSRYVLTALGYVELLTDDELRSSIFPPGHEAP